MKKFLITSLLAILAATSTTVRAQDRQEDYLGLPGDNLNLYAVMNLFQESETLEEFERKINEENSRINNLDLNGDYLVDYITVSDYVDGSVHNIVLRVALNRFENQDVAVFTVERFRNGAVQIQLIGDEALYGKNYIIEPYYASTPNPGYSGRYSNNNVTVVTTTYYEIAAWPVIRFIYRPTYAVWRSSWYWGYYPVYWNPWRPYYWHYYYGYHYNWNHHYYQHYHHSDHYRYARYDDFYYSNVRAHSAYVSRGVKEGHYKQTYSRPEQRRDGEALYARTHASSDSERRTTATVNSRSGNTYSSAKVTETARRTAPAASASSAGKSSASQSSPASHRATAPQASERPVVRQAPASRAEPTKSSKPSAPAASSQGQRRSSEARPAAAPQKSSNAPQRSSSASQKSSNAPQKSGNVSQRSSAPQKSSNASQSSNAPQKSGNASQRSSSSKDKESESGKSSRR